MTLGDADFHCFTSGNNWVLSCIGNYAKLSRTCCLDSTSTKTGSLPDGRPLIGAGEAESKTCKLLADLGPRTKPSNHCSTRLDRPKQSHEGVQQGSKSIRGTTQLQSHKGVDEKEEHQPKSKTFWLHALPVRGSALQHLTSLLQCELFSWKYPEK